MQKRLSLKQKSSRKAVPKPKQLAFAGLPRTSDRFGYADSQGRQRTTMASRQARPISLKTSMHLILKTRLAKGEWSFLKGARRTHIKTLVQQVADQFHVQLLSGANVGNHIHLHLKFSKRAQYKAFIRVLTARIAFLVTKASKVNPLKDDRGKKLSFWTQRPITRFVHGFKDFLRIENYLEINRLEGHGWPRAVVEFFVRDKYSTA
jgi:REP element-mobilizing transposase RayT